MRASDYLGPLGPLAARVPGYEYRPSQLRMADAVEDVLANEGVLLVEAGTGTGKTLAYLVPALASGLRVVVSTGTKTLQDQIMEHDLPMLGAHLPIPVDAACMKGLDNYLCLRRYEAFRESAESILGPAAKHLPVIERFRESSESGDRKELRDLPEDAVIWAHVKSGVDTRIGSKCRHFEECFVTKMRRRAESAQLIVVNHHLFFADLATRGPHGGVIPEYDAVIFDEAHQIEDVVTQFFGVTLSTTRLEMLVRDAQRALAQIRDVSPMTITTDVLRTAADLFAELPRTGDGRAPLDRDLLYGKLELRVGALDAALEALSAHCRSRASESEAVAQMSRRAKEAREALATIARSKGGSEVVWSESRGSRAAMGVSPVDVSALLRDNLFYRTRSVVLTSATLATGAKKKEEDELGTKKASSAFAFVKQRLGIDFDVREDVLESPFDYAAQVALYLPNDLPDPREARFFDAAEREVRRLVTLTGGGAFVLCTSVRAMRELAHRMRSSLVDKEGRKLPALLQGEAPKPILLEKFRAAGDAVLFATASFWEGVDVPGHALRLVIIDKLPFDVPSDPLVVARCERLREQGEEPFMKYLVPSAALALKQGFGRLVRTKSDRGIVAVLDRRIVTKGYGKVFLRSLPPARRCDSFEDVERFVSGEKPCEEARVTP